MAAAAERVRYPAPAVDGSLARDLNWELRERQLEHAGEAPRHPIETAPRIRTRTYVDPAILVRERQGVSALAVIGVAAVVILAVLVLLSYIRLTVIAADTVSLKTELAELQTRNVTLTAQYEQMFDLATVKDAAAAAGMAKPSGSQVHYLDLSGEDTAVIYREEETDTVSRVLTSLHQGVYAVVDYFD